MKIIEEVQHKCGICSDVVLLDSDTIALHIKRHKITHREYTATYLKIVNQAQSSTKKPKREELVSKYDVQNNLYPEQHLPSTTNIRKPDMAIMMGSPNLEKEEEEYNNSSYSPSN